MRRFGVSAEVLARSPRGLGYTETSRRRLAAGAGVVVASVDGATAVLRDGEASVDITAPRAGHPLRRRRRRRLRHGAGACWASASRATTAADALSAIPAVFGRGERVNVRGHEVEFVLVQNPASYQLNVDSIEPGTEQILFAIGSDVRDPSYFWPTDASSLGRVSIVSGSKAPRRRSCSPTTASRSTASNPTSARALDDFLAAPAPGAGVKTIVFSADAMRRTRAHLGLTGAE